MERLFGRSLPDVEVQTGMAAELEPLGAEALTIGRSIAFAEDQPSPALVAHEATHVLQNERAGATAAMASGVVAPRDSAAEAEADANARSVAAHGMGVRLPPVAASPAAQVHLAPKRLVPQGDTSPRESPLLLPDANHPSRRDADGEQVIQTTEVTAPGKGSPLRQSSWSAIAEVAESVHVQDDAGDTLHIDLTYRLESRPAEIGELPDLWIHTERKALLTIGSGEHAGATIVGQARIHLAPGASRDPKSVIAMASLGPNHWAQVYLAEAQQFVNLHGAGGRRSLLADAAGNDVLAYDDPLRTLIGLKNILKQQHVAGRGTDVAKTHMRAQQLLVDAKRAHAVLEREISSIKSHHDPQPGRVAPVKFLVGDIAEWLASNHQAGRDDTEEARQLRKEHVALEHLIADAEKVRPPKRDQLDDTLMAPVRFAERTTEGAKEVGAMAIDAVVLSIDAIGKATGIGTFDYHPLSKYGQAIETAGADTTTALVTMVNGFADEWSDAVERAKHGDYRGLTDVSLDTLMLIDGARTGGVVAVDKVEAVASKIDRIAKTARAVARSAYATGATVPAEVRNIAAALGDGADAFLARLGRAGGMQMAAAGGGSGGGPKIGGLSAEALAEAAKAAKEAFNDKRQAQHAPKPGKNASAGPDAGTQAHGPTEPAEIAKQEARRAAKSAAGNAETNATKKYIFDASEKALVKKKVRDAALEAAEKAYEQAIGKGETPGEANRAANDAASDVAESIARAEADRTATNAAHATRSGDGIDLAKLDPDARNQLTGFKSGKAGAQAKQLAQELEGLSEKEFVARMSTEPCTMKPVDIDGPPPQIMRVYEYPDGTVVRYKPLGDSRRRAPTYSVEMKKDPSLPDQGKDDAAFKVDPSGKALPRDPFQVQNPYPKGSPQWVRFRDALMDAGHRTLK